VRFLADMGVAVPIVEELRRQGHDALHLRDEGLQRSPDQQILDKAIAEDRILLTFDLLSKMPDTESAICPSGADEASALN